MKSSILALAAVVALARLSAAQSFIIPPSGSNVPTVTINQTPAGVVVSSNLFVNGNIVAGGTITVSSCVGCGGGGGGGGSSVYPATATASFPFGLFASSAVIGTVADVDSASPFTVNTSSLVLSVSPGGAVDVPGFPITAAAIDPGCGATPTITAGSNCQRGSMTIANMGGTTTCGFASLGALGGCFENQPFCIWSGFSNIQHTWLAQTAWNSVQCKMTATALNCAFTPGAFISWMCFGN